MLAVVDIAYIAVGASFVVGASFAVEAFASCFEAASSSASSSASFDSSVLESPHYLSLNHCFERWWALEMRWMPLH